MVNMITEGDLRKVKKAVVKSTNKCSSEHLVRRMLTRCTAQSVFEK